MPELTPPPRSRARIALAVTFLALYTAFVLLVTMWPAPVDRDYDSAIERLLGVLHRNGVPRWFDYRELEFSANIGMFVPLGFLAGLALPRRVWWLAIFVVPAFSVAIELAQAVLLPARVAAFSDVLANSIGGLLGVFAAFVLRAIVNGRDEKIVARALWEHGVR